MASSELGLLFYVVNKRLRRMDVPLMMEDEARTYIAAKILTVQREEPKAPAAPPAYFLPLSALKPIETTAEPLTAEAIANDFADEQDQALEKLNKFLKKNCEDPDCPIHGKTDEANKQRNFLRRVSPVFASVLDQLNS